MAEFVSPMKLLTISGAILPSLVLLYIFYKRDYYPEPRRVLIATFFLGLLTVVPVTGLSFVTLDPLMHFLKMYPDVHPAVVGFYMAFFCAAVPEELCKFLVLRGYSVRHKAFDEPMDGVVYGVAASLGFATVENILYVDFGGGYTAAIRAITAVPSHACDGALMGYFVGQAKFNPLKKNYAWLGLFVAIVFHGLYDLPLMSKGYNLFEWYTGDSLEMYFVALAVLWAVVMAVQSLWVFNIVRRLRREQVRFADKKKR